MKKSLAIRVGILATVLTGTALTLSAKTTAQLQAEAELACEKALQENTEDALNNFRLKYGNFPTACSAVASTEAPGQSSGGERGSHTGSSGSSSSGGSSDGGSSDGGSSDGGSSDGGSSDGGSSDGGSSDGGSGDGGSSDGGSGDGGGAD